MTAMPSSLNQLYTYSHINILSVKVLIIQCPQPRSLPHVDYNVFQTLFQNVPLLRRLSWLLLYSEILLDLYTV